jgi:hypothetical protein
MTISERAAKANWPQAARENESNSAASITQQAARVEARDSVRQHALKRDQRGQHQERAEHVRIVERAARAAIEQEQVGEARRTAEIGRDGDERRDSPAASIRASARSRACVLAPSMAA